MMKKILFTLVGLISLTTVAQERKIKKANKNYSNLAFIDAQRLYTRIAENGNASAEVLAKLADTYYFNDDLTQSYEWYNQLFENYRGDIKPEYYFRYAQSLKAVEKYDEADEIMARFKKMDDVDISMTNYDLEPNYLEMIDFQSGRFDIENAREINSFTADFGPSFYYGKDQVVFATARDTGGFVKRKHDWNEQSFLELYTTNIDGAGKLTEARRLSSILNSKWHESTTTFSADGNRVYFTRNNTVNEKLYGDNESLTRLKIYRSDRSGDSWSDPVSVSLNGDEFNTAHPALTPDGKMLFFVSDREGTVGYDVDADFTGSDLWVADVADDGSLSNPRNVTDLNTTGRETFPFVSKSNVLYFASNGHQGLGGLDVFASQIGTNGTMGEVINVGKPINTPFDDFGYIVNDDNKQGYFTSNRYGGMGDDDIYRFIQTQDLRNPCEIVVKGVVTDEFTGEPLSNAIVTINNQDYEANEPIVTASDGAYMFKIGCEMDYIIRASKDGFIPDEKVFTTPKNNTTVQVPLKLQNASLPVLECDDLASILDIEQIYFDFDKSAIRNDAAQELSKILAFLEMYPKTKIDIRSHTDSRGDDNYNEQLSERRAQSTRSWLVEKGIDSNRITAKGYGEQRLVNDCSNGVPCTAAQHQMNRRSEFIVTGLDNYAGCD